MARQGAQPRAGCINQEGIKLTDQIRRLRRQGDGIPVAGLNAAQAQAFAVAGHPAQARLTAVEGQHLPLIAHQFRQVRALAPRGRAGIEHPLTRLGIE